MKLFTKKELKEEREGSLEVIRGKEIEAAKAFNARLRQINDLEALHQERMLKNAEELAQAEFKLKTIASKEGSLVESLEERKRQALQPIVAELKQIEIGKAELTKLLNILDAREKELGHIAATLKLKEREIEQSKQDLLKVQSETTSFIERQKKEAKDIITRSESALKALQSEQELSHKRLLAAEAKERDAEKAEAIARATMASVDSRLEKAEKKEKKLKSMEARLTLAWKEIKNYGKR